VAGELPLIGIEKIDSLSSNCDLGYIR